jgi:methanogenic corrinoid protein MtbC1
MSDTANDDSKRHPIRVVAHRTGLTQDLLRAWELRYDVVRPQRSHGGQRRYSDADVERPRLLRSAVETGRRIGEVASLPTEELVDMVREDARHLEPGASGGAAGSGSARDYMYESLSAIQEFDARRLEETLDRAALVLPSTDFAERVVSPLMRLIGDLWAHEQLTPAHERLASSVVRRMLDALREDLQKNSTGPRMVVGTPSRQYHEIGAMLVATTAAALGWRVVYVGADVPGAAIADAARQTGAQVVALSIVYPPNDERIAADLRELKRSLRKNVSIVAGGPAAGVRRRPT